MTDFTLHLHLTLIQSSDPLSSSPDLNAWLRKIEKFLNCFSSNSTFSRLLTCNQEEAFPGSRDLVLVGSNQ